MPDTAVHIPGYLAGTWSVDPVHSDASFTVRHLVSKVRGRFQKIDGQINAAENPLDSSVAISIDPSSIDTNNQQRDNHLRSADFLEVEKYPAMTFTSTGIRQHGDGFLIDGNLTIKDITKQITAALEIGGFTLGHDGTPRAGYSATFEIDRNDYNVNFNWVLETGGIMVGDKITIQLEVAAILQQN